MVTFADETGHIIFSGSDDSLCKVHCTPVILKGHQILVNDLWWKC